MPKCFVTTALSLQRNVRGFLCFLLFTTRTLSGISAASASTPFKKDRKWTECDAVTKHSTHFPKSFCYQEGFFSLPIILNKNCLSQGPSILLSAYECQILEQRQREDLDVQDFSLYCWSVTDVKHLPDVKPFILFINNSTWMSDALTLLVKPNCTLNSCKTVYTTLLQFTLDYNKPSTCRHITTYYYYA